MWRICFGLLLLSSVASAQSAGENSQDPASASDRFFPDPAVMARIKAQAIQRQNAAPTMRPQTEQQPVPQKRQFKIDLSKGAIQQAVQVAPCSIPLLTFKPGTEYNYTMPALVPPQIDKAMIVAPPAPACANKIEPGKTPNVGAQPEK